MKRFLNWLDDAWPLGCSVISLIFLAWITYKVFSGAYHLLDKLIDKI